MTVPVNTLNSKPPNICVTVWGCRKFRVQGLGFKDFESWVSGVGSDAFDLGFRAFGSRFRTFGSGFRVVQRAAFCRCLVQQPRGLVAPV